MVSTTEHLCIGALILFAIFKNGITLKCYQCTSATSIYCSDGLIHSGALVPESCDHVFEARYCIKSMGLAGGIGAKRFCSSLDLGNYCNYVKQPGDVLEYRSCVFTCTGDGCNSGNLAKTSIVKILLMNIISIFIVSLFILNIKTC